MRFQPLTLRAHAGFLLLFAIFMIGVLMVPVLLAGFPYWVSPILHDARIFADTGVLLPGQMHLVVLFVWALHSFISWQNLIGWTCVSVSVFCAALIPLWVCVYRLFDARIAWVTTVVFGFMPMYWTEATRMAGYPFAFFFLFLGSAIFLALHERHRTLAVMAFGLCFGAVLASHHTFLTFPFWFVGGYLWEHRKTWRRALVEVVLFAVCVGLVFVLPQMPNALKKDQTLVQRLAVFIPSASDHLPGVGHLYPDQYAYTFLREDFDRMFAERAGSGGFFGAQENENLRVIFHAGGTNVLSSFSNGFWLFLNALPSLFLDETVGGAFLWIFIVPGISWLFVHRRRLLLHFVGLWLFMELLLRFVLHYGRMHVIDIGWMIALFTGIGIVSVAEALQARAKKLTLSVICLLLLLAVSAQLVQANRKLFARLYTKSNVPESYAAAEALKSVPADAVIADPRKDYLFVFTDRKHVTIAGDTIAFLAPQRKVKDPFQYFHVTHMIGYSEEEAALIKEAVPGIREITYQKGQSSVQVTPFIKYLLHLIR